MESAIRVYAKLCQSMTKVALCQQHASQQSGSVGMAGGTCSISCFNIYTGMGKETVEVIHHCKCSLSTATCVGWLVTTSAHPTSASTVGIG